MMRDAVFTNWRLKLLSVFLAAALLVFVRGERAREEVVNLQIPVRVKNVPSDRVLVSALIEKLTVTIAGPRSRVRDVAQQPPAPIEIDAARQSSGPYRFFADHFDFPKGVKIVTIVPPEVTLEFEEKIEKRVAVKIVHRGEPPSGFRLDHISVDPPEVVASGPRGRVERVTFVATEEMPLASSTKSFDRDARLVVNGLGVRVAIDRVRVKVVVSPIIERRRLASLPVRLFIDTDRKLSSALEPTSIDIDVEGPVNQLSALRESDIQATIDLRGRHISSPTTLESAARIDGLPIEVRPVGFAPKKFKIIVTKRR